MKPTEKVSIGGYSFNIEDAALESLRAYLDAVRNSSPSDGKELCEDIEERIAELLLERCSSERVVNKAMIDEIRSIIGEPEMFDDEGDKQEAHSSPSGNNTQKIRLFRDIEDKMIGGVCSGLAKRFDVDVALVRLGFGVLFLLCCFWEEWAGFVLLAYGLLWICIPAAKTVEEKCSMSRKPLSYDQFYSKKRSLKETSSDCAQEIRSSPLLQTILRVLMLIVGFEIFITGMSLLCVGSGMMLYPDFIIDRIPLNDYTDLFFKSKGIILSTGIMIGLLGLCFIYPGILLIFKLKSPKWRPGLILLLVWISSVIYLGVAVGIKVSNCGLLTL